jgi:UDP-N-acetylmuramoyl-tripeptide--D-alanyl-D-alanine ligase
MNISPMQLPIGQVVQWLADARLVGALDTVCARVHTDTRTIQAGDLFVALRGEKFDANTMLHQAAERGACAIVCHTGLAADLLPNTVARIEVPDTTVALGQLAAAWRKQFNLPLIAVTGSNGKTTVTQMIASILQACAPNSSLATQGNLNNEIGVPLTLLRLRAHHTLAVVELGMNHPGEIARLAAIVQPTVALVNNAQREHMEFMQTVQAVAEENGSVLTSLPAQGDAVFPADDEYSPLWQTLAGACRTARFALEDVGFDDTLVCQQAVWQEGAWSVVAAGLGVQLQYRLAIAGRHNVKNSLAAAACALRAGVPVDRVEHGLQVFQPVKGRSRALRLQLSNRSVDLIDDTYNANPDSVRAAMDVLAELPAPRLLVLGDMGEVGAQGAEFHLEAGRYAKERGIDFLMAIGDLSRAAVYEHPVAYHFSSMEALIQAVRDVTPQLGSVLVKGSRFMRMEQVVESLLVTHGEASC